MSTPIFIKVTLLQGGQHHYIAADVIHSILPTAEGTRIVDKESPGNKWHVRENVGQIFDQLREPFLELPSERKGPSVEETVARLQAAKESLTPEQK